MSGYGEVIHADSLDYLRRLPAESVDSIVTDPPAGIEFMGKEWDAPSNTYDAGHTSLFGRPTGAVVKAARSANPRCLNCGGTKRPFKNDPTARCACVSPLFPEHEKRLEDRQAFVGWLSAIMRECFRALKPGGHALVWALPRTSHWTATAIENAGFEIRDRIHDVAAADNALLAFVDSLTDAQRDALLRLIDGQATMSPILMQVFGQGFPKSMDIAKALDKAAGVQPIGERPASLGMATGPNADQWNTLNRQLVMPPPTTVEAQRWEGWGTALKPAVEHWIVARKPVIGTVIENVRTFGTGAINIDGCRVEGENPSVTRRESSRKSGNAPVGGVSPTGWANRTDASTYMADRPSEHLGRFPAHLILEHSSACREIGQRSVRSGTAVLRNGGGQNIFGGIREAEKTARIAGENHGFGDGGKEVIPAWECVAGCPVRALDQQSGTLKSGQLLTKHRKSGGSQIGTFQMRDRTGEPGEWAGDTGGASRFFYCAKPTAREKDAGCDQLPAHTPAELTGREEGSAGLVMKHTDGSAKANPYAGTSGARPRRNSHPTVKAVGLMRWLVRLVTPPGGLVLDPFCGSGTTGVAAIHEGMGFLGIEREQDYVRIAQARIEHAERETRGNV